MAERGMVFEGAQFGVEGLLTPGTPVQATKISAGMGFTVTPNPEVKNYTPKGFLFPTASVLIKEQTDLKVDGLLTYNEGVYPLASVLTNPVITTPGGATLTRQWLYSLLDNAPNSQRTLSMEFGKNDPRAWHVTNALLTELGLTFNRKDVVKMAAAGFAQAGADDKVRWLTITGTPTGGSFTITVGANTTAAIAWNAAAAAVQSALVAIASVGAGNAICTGGPLPGTPVRILFTGALNVATNPTLPTPLTTTDSFTGGTLPTSGLSRLSPSATQLDLLPVSPTTITVKAAATQAGLAAASALTRDFTYTWKLSGRDNPVYPLNAANGAGFAATVEALPKGESTFDVAADDVGMGFLANLRQGNTLFVRVAATGPLIETGYYHSLQIDTALKLLKVSEFKDVDGTLLGVTYTGEWCHDPTWGYATQVTIQNTLTAL